MSIVRLMGMLLSAAAATGLTGCATGLHTDAPAGANLAGAWKLDPGASDDPQKVLAQMRTEAARIIARGAQPPPPPLPAHGAAPRDTRPQEEPYDDSAVAAVGPGGHRPDPLQRSPMAHIIQAAVGRGDFLTVRQGPGEFVLDYGTSRRSFTPGAHSVVSAEGGVADQTSGWKGREYVIEINAQLGPEVTEAYGLSADGKHLVEKLHISGGELPAVTLTRVYAPTTEIAPRQLPTDD